MSLEIIATLAVTAFAGIPGWIDLILTWKNRKK